MPNKQYEFFHPKRERSSYSREHRDPVATVSWEDAKKYCLWLAEKSGFAARLPSESEWECACRAGSQRQFCFGDDEMLLEEYAWYDVNSDDRVHEVGTRRANAWGLCDFHGNVWEWCEDTYHENYEGAPTDGSAWAKEGASIRVSRGGSWVYPAEGCRSADRNRYRPPGRNWGIGFRCAFLLLAD